MKLLITREVYNKWIEDLFFTEEEVKVLDHWLKGDSIIETSLDLNLSTATVSRRRKSIKDKINLVIDKNIIER